MIEVLGETVQEDRKRTPLVIVKSIRLVRELKETWSRKRGEEWLQVTIRGHL